MAFTDINGEDRLVQQTFADQRDRLGWDSVYAYNAETFGADSLPGRSSERDAVLLRDLRAALDRLNPDLPQAARQQAADKLTRIDFARWGPQSSSYRDSGGAMPRKAGPRRAVLMGSVTKGREADMYASTRSGSRRTGDAGGTALAARSGPRPARRRVRVDTPRTVRSASR